MFQKEWGLSDLIDVNEWQKLQDSFSETLGITLRTISVDSKLLSNTSRPTRVCTEILPKIHSSSNFCSTCILGIDIKNGINIKEETNFKCPFGLEVFVVPIRAFGDKVVAYVVVGPLIVKSRKDASEYEKDAKKAGVSLEELMDALIEINVFSYTKIYAITKLIKETFSYVAQTGYHKKRLGEIVPEVIEIDPLFSRYYEEKILNALLNSCALALDADSGSVMTLDKKTNMLHIKVASKLDEEIINKTNIKIGEGIAGVAAATAKPIILPKDEKKNGLSEKMKRKYIKSSMIIPFNKANSADVYGVINLNMVRKDKDFSDRDISVVKELVNLASIALIPLQQTNPDWDT